MCGFVGIISLDGAPVSPASLVRAANVQRHRGPDDQGFLLVSRDRETADAFHAGQCPAPAGHDVGLGFNRLSIIDLSIAGHQPMTTGDGACHIVFNGEIYNFEDLHRQLEAEGVSFRSRTDTEVILRYYERYGIHATLEELNGMFAFAIVDTKSGLVHVARDRFGVKPIYIGRQGNALAFASEVKSIFAFADFAPELADKLDDPRRQTTHFTSAIHGGIRARSCGCRRSRLGVHDSVWSLPWRRVHCSVNSIQRGRKCVA